MNSHVVVADRYPIVDGGEITGGSLVKLVCSGLSAQHIREQTIWVSPVASCAPGYTAGMPGLSIIQVPVGSETLSRYYLSVGAARVWMVLHGISNALPIEALCAEDWKSFVEVNRRIAEVVVSDAPVGARVSVHDYNLLLSVPEIRCRRPDLSLAYVHHVPWPHRESIADLASLELVRLLAEAAATADGVSVSALKWHHNLKSWSDKIQVIVAPPGIDIPELNKQIRVSSGCGYWENQLANLEGPIIATVGRTDPSKNFDTVLRAWISLVSAGAAGTLCIHLVPSSRSGLTAYRAYGESLTKLIREANQIRSNSVVSIENEAQTDALKLLKFADIVAVCSRSDGWNLVAVEAASLGPERQHLILSSTIGATDLLSPISTVTNNPLDRDELVAALGNAIHSGPRRALTRRRDLLIPSPGEWFRSVDSIHRIKNLIRDRTID